MKFVSLVIAVMMISFGAAAQTTGHAAQNRTVAKIQQTVKGQKAKAAVAKSTAVITLKDERAYKAKWTFEEMLRRRLEIGAEESEKRRGKE